MELKSKLNIANMSFIQGFHGKDIRVIVDRGRGAVVATFTGNYNGRDYYHVRELRDNYGDWAPGKGLSVPTENKKDLLRELALEYIAMCSTAEQKELQDLIAETWQSA